MWVLPQWTNWSNGILCPPFELQKAPIVDNPVYGTWDELVIEMEVGVAWQCEWGSECDVMV